MKFIKAENGDYVNVETIEAFKITNSGIDGEVRPLKSFVIAYTHIGRCVLIEFSCDPKSTTQFDPKEEAQAWLDNLIAELNE